jgi:hypothetical protein
MFPIYLWEDKKYWETLNKYDKYRVILIAIYYFITKKAFKRPKVVGPYRIYTPFYRVDGKSLADWERLQWMVFIKRLVLKLFSLLSIRQRYHSIKWFLFRVKFVPQLKALRKRKSSNYNFFKNKPKE